MPIRYCSATSKRTKKPCRARAMRGMNVCYHHGGKSLRGVEHPNFKHGFYFQSRPWLLGIAFRDYCRALRRQQLKDVEAELSATMSREPLADNRRFWGAYLARIRSLSRPQLTPELASWVLHWRWEGWPDKVDTTACQPGEALAMAEYDLAGLCNRPTVSGKSERGDRRQ